jgi:predicted nucleic acid-binding protein
MKIVADTNIFLAVTFNEPEKEQIIQLSAGHELIAPDVLPFEIGNALTAMLKRKILAKEEVLAAWEIIRKIPIEYRHTDIQSALKIAILHNIYAYDAYFLHCAEQLRSPILTLDRQMQKVAGEMGISLVE